MTNFVWIAKDKEGNRVVREVPAETAAESKAILLAQGVTNLELAEEEVHQAACMPLNKPTMFLGEDLNVKVTAEERLKHRGMPPPTYFSALWNGVLQAKISVAVIAGFSAWFIYRQQWLAAGLAFLALFCWLAMLLLISVPLITYRKLVNAADWHRWNEVLSLISRLHKINRVHFAKIPEPELGRFRAQALAGSGDLNKALAEYEQFENTEGCPGWLYQAHVASIYCLAREYDRAIACYTRILSEKPLPIMYLDLANFYARYKKDPVHARTALAEAEKADLPDITKPNYLRCRGIISWLEGDYPGAQRDLEAAIQGMEATRHVPFREGNSNVGKAYLALVLAKQGNLSTARRYYVEAKPYLVATKEHDLIGDCEKALGRETA